MMNKAIIYVPAVLAGIAIGGFGIMQVMAQRTPGVVANPTTATASQGALQTGNYGQGAMQPGSMNPDSGTSGMARGGSQAGQNSGEVPEMGQGMMQGYQGGSGNQQVMSEAEAATLMQSSLSNATVNKAKNSIVFTGSNVTIVFDAGPENADGKFVVGGLVNPNIQVSKGANVTFKVINMDLGMPHGIEVTSSTPPYGYMSMMRGNIYSGSFITPLPDAQQGKYPMASTSFTATQTGNFYYLCQVPGHAEKGMYGKISIV